MDATYSETSIDFGFEMSSTAKRAEISAVCGHILGEGWTLVELWRYTTSTSDHGDRPVVSVTANSTMGSVSASCEQGSFPISRLAKPGGDGRYLVPKSGEPLEIAANLKLLSRIGVTLDPPVLVNAVKEAIEERGAPKMPAMRGELNHL